MLVAIKYCGGCNPRYNRADISAMLKEDFPELSFTGADAENPDYALVVCGCNARCAEIGKLSGKHGISVIASMDCYKSLRDTLCRILDKERFDGLEGNI